ncbi:hypothetical protein [Draconibacterium sediminis]|uniref:Uncharacterized protein n=1 Tax=Draconibacterium sediminis TaxID=1544798 RepID=A0A0D8J7Q0_9BACT|nr:hypothetical protein [Draconibacterium sediminis]KJF42907.1 hypothetical protein LH29_15990 [Draconibacterium sediminis]
MILRFLTIFTVLICFVFGSVSGAEHPEKDVRIKSRGSLSYNKRDAKIKVYIEGARLDMDYMRRNMRFADFVNDPAVADVHIIINSRVSGSGGMVYSLMYNNLTFENFSDFTITCTTLADDTNEEERRKIKDALSLGLMPFVNQTKASDQISFRYRGEVEQAQVAEVDDPWNNWTFRGDISGSVNLEESKKNYNYAFYGRADKVTDEIRIRNNARRSVNTKKYTTDGEEYRSDNTSTYGSSSVVKSLSSRWSTGLFGSFYNSNYRNTKYSMSVKPAVEYNIFPWDVSDRKVFTIAYYIGPEWMKYYEESIYDKLEESLWEQSLRLDLQIVQTWGEVKAGLNATNYMHDWTKNRITFDTDLSVRIIRGLSVRMGFTVENVHDQIYLPKGDISLEDVLLNKVQLPSSFEVGANVGIRVQFGSIYNNIVNNRL